MYCGLTQNKKGSQAAFDTAISKIAKTETTYRIFDGTSQHDQQYLQSSVYQCRTDGIVSKLQYESLC